MSTRKNSLRGLDARLELVTLGNMYKFDRFNFIFNSQLYVKPEELVLYFPKSSKTFVKKCGCCGRYVSSFSRLANFPPLCSKCVGEMWFYSNTANDPFRLKSKRVLTIQDCRKIYSYIATLRLTSNAARDRLRYQAIRILLGRDEEE